MNPLPRTLVLFPGALGDLLCCWPGLQGLALAGESVTLCARPDWAAVLPADGVAARVSFDRREIAELFSSGPLTRAPAAILGGHQRVISFVGAGDGQFAARLAAVAGAAPALHPLRGMRPGQHASDYFARCLATTPGPEHLPVADGAREWCDELWRTHRLGSQVLVLHTGSGARRKVWEGAAGVAETWLDTGGEVIALAGPAEREPSTPTAKATVSLHNVALPLVAAVLRRSARFLGNDSGISHLAGLVGARGVAVFGPSDPSMWRPLGGGVDVLCAPASCARCGPERLCTHRVPVDAVLAALVRT